MLLNAAVVFTFSQFYNIPLHKYAKVAYYFITVGHLGYFCFGELMNNATVNIIIYLFWWVCVCFC